MTKIGELFLSECEFSPVFKGMEQDHFSGYRHMRNVARQLRRDATPAEQVLWEKLRGRRCEGYRFLRQRAIGIYVVDFT